MNKNQRSVFYHCCFGYMVSGMATLVLGAILPFIIKEASLNYTQAGVLISAMAIGNLASCVIYPILENKLGKKFSITFSTACMSLSYFCLTFLPSFYIMILLMFLSGAERGCITIFNNASVNKISNSSGKYVNLLHCSFAVGAFIAPVITALISIGGLNWRIVLYIITLLCILASLSFFTINYTLLYQENEHLKDSKEKTTVDQKQYLKSFDFYCIALLLAFYLGFENCVNGWFITYLQSTNKVSETLSATLVSFTWAVILIGRLFCIILTKWFSKSMIVLLNTIGSGICFIILITSASAFSISAALLGVGFFMAGICPTGIAMAGTIMNGSTAGMSLFTAIYALGGIITPQIVGSIADQIGIVDAVSILVINATAMIICSIILSYRKKCH